VSTAAAVSATAGVFTTTTFSATILTIWFAGVRDSTFGAKVPIVGIGAAFVGLKQVIGVGSRKDGSGATFNVFATSEPECHRLRRCVFCLHNQDSVFAGLGTVALAYDLDVCRPGCGSALDDQGVGGTIVGSKFRIELQGVVGTRVIARNR